jgi:hypothetical protein
MLIVPYTESFVQFFVMNVKRTTRTFIRRPLLAAKWTVVGNRRIRMLSQDGIPNTEAIGHTASASKVLKFTSCQSKGITKCASAY